MYGISYNQTFLLEEFIEGIGGFALLIWEKMPVSVNRCDDAGMPQSFLDDCVLCFLVDQQGDVRVPKIVNPNLLHRGITLADTFVAHANRVLVAAYQRCLEHRRIFAPVEG